MNFFEWVRVGVKQSVLAGFADAVESIGVPVEDKGETKELLQSLRGNSAAMIAPGGKSSHPRKRLGRSLTHMQPNTEANG